MNISYDCEYCGKGQTVPAGKAGTTVSCHYCGGDGVVPAASSRAAPIGGPVAGGYPTPPTAYHPPPASPGSGPKPGPSAFGPPPSAFQTAQGGNPYSAPRAPLGHQGDPRALMASQAESAATTAVVLAALSWVLSCLLLAPISLHFASKSRRLAAAAGVPTPTAATIATGISAVYLVLFVLVIGFFFLAAVAGSL